MIGMDDFADPTPPPSQASHHNSRLSAPPPPAPINNGKAGFPLSTHSDNEHGVGTISDRWLIIINLFKFKVKNSLQFWPSAHTRVDFNSCFCISSSSSLSSDSDSDSDAPDNVKVKNGYGNASASTKVNGHDLATLDEDLCLSESGSDSD